MERTRSGSVTGSKRRQVRCRRRRCAPSRGERECRRRRRRSVVLTVRRDAVVIVVFILAIWDAVAVAVHLLEVVGFRRRRRRCLAVRDAVAVVS